LFSQVKEKKAYYFKSTTVNSNMTSFIGNIKNVCNLKSTIIVSPLVPPMFYENIDVMK